MKNLDFLLLGFNGRNLASKSRYLDVPYSFWVKRSVHKGRAAKIVFFFLSCPNVCTKVHRAITQTILQHPTRFNARLLILTCQKNVLTFMLPQQSIKRTKPKLFPSFPPKKTYRFSI